MMYPRMSQGGVPRSPCCHSSRPFRCLFANRASGGSARPSCAPPRPSRRRHPRSARPSPPRRQHHSLQHRVKLCASLPSEEAAKGAAERTEPLHDHLPHFLGVVLIHVPRKALYLILDRSCMHSRSVTMHAVQKVR
jgi:hypothetical protein